MRLDMWRANTDTPNNRTRPITEERVDIDTARLCYEIRGAEWEKTKLDPSGLVGSKTTDSKSQRSAKPRDDLVTHFYAA
jgi:hypothetical protein